MHLSFSIIWSSSVCNLSALWYSYVRLWVVFFYPRLPFSAFNMKMINRDLWIGNNVGPKKWVRPTQTEMWHLLLFSSTIWKKPNSSFKDKIAVPTESTIHLCFGFFIHLNRVIVNKRINNSSNYLFFLLSLNTLVSTHCVLLLYILMQ